MVYQFKDKGFTTILIGRMFIDEINTKWFYIQRADGTMYKYDEGIIEWYKGIA